MALVKGSSAKQAREEVSHNSGKLTHFTGLISY